MCGIAGVVDFTAPVCAREAQTRRMLHALRHRGPDDSGLVTHQHAALGATRLSLVDRAGGAQPLQSDDGRYTLVFNGEIYNHVELRDQLRSAWKFHGIGDTEVLLAALATWNQSALDRLDGMFAFFLWDEARQHGLAARDRFGIKPFTFARDGDVFHFASEAKAIVAARESSPRAHFDSILEYLVAPSMSGVEHAMFEGIEHLAPGHALWIERESVRLERWWAWRPDPCAADADPGPIALDLSDRLATAVASSRALEHPTALFLSGGLDSTLLGAHAGRAWPEPPRAYTIRFTDQHEFRYANSLIVTSDDTPFAALAAKELELSHEWVDVRRAGIATDLHSLAIIDDALPAWEQELAQHHLARAASRTHRAVMVGDAADELFHGYHFLLDDRATRSPAAILRRFGEVPLRRDLLADPIAHFAGRYLDLIHAAGHDFATPAGRVLATTELILARWLPRLLHNGDIHTMAFGLEARVPFARLAVADLAARIHPALGLAHGVEKSVLRRAAIGLVPAAIRLRKKSSLPKDQGVGRLYQREAARLVPEASPFLSAFLDLDRLRQVWESRQPLDEMERALLFRVIALCHWSQHYGVKPP